MISVSVFQRKNPNWRPDEDGAQFMSQLRESVDSMHHSYPSMMSSGYGNKPLPYEHAHPNASVTYLTAQPQDVSDTGCVSSVP